MLAPTHMTFGSSLSLMVLSVFGVASSLHWSVIAAAILGSLMPDIDMPRSTIGRLAPFISTRIERKFGHRGATHSLIGWLIATVIFAIFVLGFLVFVGWVPSFLAEFSVALDFYSLDDFLPILLPSTTGWGLRWITAFSVGYLSHLLLDMLNPRGVPLLWPSSGRDVVPGDVRLRPKTGSKTEGWIFSGTVILLLIALPLSEFGAMDSFRWILGSPDSAIEMFKTSNTQTYVQFKGMFRDSKMPDLIVHYQGEIYRLGNQAGADIIAKQIRVVRTDEPISITVLRMNRLMSDDKLMSHAGLGIDPDQYASGVITLPEGLKLGLPEPRTSVVTLWQTGNKLHLNYASRADILAISIPGSFWYSQDKDGARLEELETQVAALEAELSRHKDDGWTELGRELFQDEGSEDLKKKQATYERLAVERNWQKVRVQDQGRMSFTGELSLRRQGQLESDTLWMQF